MNVSKFEKIRRAELSKNRDRNRRYLTIGSVVLVSLLVIYLYNAILISARRGMGSDAKVTFTEWKNQVSHLFSEVKKKNVFYGINCANRRDPPPFQVPSWESLIKDVTDDKSAADAILSRQTLLKAPRFSEERILLTATQLIKSAIDLELLSFYKDKRKDGLAPRVLLLNGGAFEWGYTGDTRITLGEIVQWTDLMSAFLVLGADVSFVTKRDDLSLIFCRLISNKFDIIVTDYIGAFTLDQAISVAELTAPAPVEAVNERSSLSSGAEGPTSMKKLIDEKTWILDYFGTDAERNYAVRSEDGKDDLYCCRKLPLSRFLTAYNRPPNTFLGGLVLLNDRKEKRKREQTVVIYGKLCSFLKSVPNALSTIRLFKNLGWRVVDTFHVDDAEMTQCELPKDSEHLGILNQEQLLELMRSSKILLGIGRPLIGPMPLEAVAAGMVVVLPRYDTPLSCTDDEDLSVKPIECKQGEWTSQHPKLEKMAKDKGSTNVYTVDFADVEAVTSIANKVASLDDDEFEDTLGVVEDYHPRAFLTRVSEIMKSVVY
jgi:hypothetical protein